jgi:hypothetical protein
MILQMRRLLIAVFSVVLCAGMMAGCKDQEVHKETEVHDKPFGGTQVKEKTVTEEGDKIKVEEKTTDIDRHGNVTKEKKSTEGERKP